MTKKPTTFQEWYDDNDIIPNPFYETIQGRISDVIDDLFGHRRTNWGYLDPRPDDDELMVFGIKLLEKYQIYGSPTHDIPWIKEFMGKEETRLRQEALQSLKKCD